VTSPASDEALMVTGANYDVSGGDSVSLEMARVSVMGSSWRRPIHGNGRWCDPL